MKVKVPSNLPNKFRVTNAFFGFIEGSYYVAQAGLGFMVLLALSHECWVYSHVPPCLATNSFFA